MLLHNIRLATFEGPGYGEILGDALAWKGGKIFWLGRWGARLMRHLILCLLAGLYASCAGVNETSSGAAQGVAQGAAQQAAATATQAGTAVALPATALGMGIEAVPATIGFAQHLAAVPLDLADVVKLPLGLVECVFAPLPNVELESGLGHLGTGIQAPFHLIIDILSLPGHAVTALSRIGGNKEHK